MIEDSEDGGYSDATRPPYEDSVLDHSATQLDGTAHRYVKDLDMSQVEVSSIEEDSQKGEVSEYNRPSATPVPSEPVAPFTDEEADESHLDEKEGDKLNELLSPGLGR